ncbi:hypothetical protein ALC53_10445 [Atta colombica]|uniref:Uncharacterized protein n=1 Tax=Atta colombica TaxID=520822 RepID=A0A151I161_9HYME|nr:hypothetical protein ALC53_10445 [Atta colombica]
MSAPTQTAHTQPPETTRNRPLILVAMRRRGRGSRRAKRAAAAAAAAAAAVATAAYRVERQRGCGRTGTPDGGGQYQHTESGLVNRRN